MAKRLQVDGRQLRRKALTGANTKSVTFAHYFDAMRQKIAAYGSTFFRVQMQTTVWQLGDRGKRGFPGAYCSERSR